MEAGWSVWRRWEDTVCWVANIIWVLSLHSSSLIEMHAYWKYAKREHGSNMHNIKWIQHCAKSGLSRLPFPFSKSLLFDDERLHIKIKE